MKQMKARLPTRPFEVPTPGPIEFPTRPDIPHRFPDESPGPAPWEAPEPEPDPDEPDEKLTSR
jgi:hypothetical protein